jgi:hypothetical protein
MNGDVVETFVVFFFGFWIWSFLGLLIFEMDILAVLWIILGVFIFLWSISGKDKCTWVDPW